MQEEDIFESTNGKCHILKILVCKKKIFLSILMASVICVHCSQLVDQCMCNISMHLITLVNILMPRYL
jgi:hypothetical protein